MKASLTDSRHFPRFAHSIPINVFEGRRMTGFGEVVDFSLEGVRLRLHALEARNHPLGELRISPLHDTSPDSRWSLLVIWREQNEIGGVFLKPQAFYALKRLVTGS